jgi:hypothetical protein
VTTKDAELVHWAASVTVMVYVPAGTLLFRFCCVVPLDHKYVLFPVPPLIVVKTPPVLWPLHCTISVIPSMTIGRDCNGIGASWQIGNGTTATSYTPAIAKASDTTRSDN